MIQNRSKQEQNIIMCVTCNNYDENYTLSKSSNILLFSTTQQQPELIETTKNHQFYTMAISGIP